MSYAHPSAGRNKRVLVCSDHLSSRRFNRKQVFEHLDLINPSMLIFATSGRVNNHVRQYARERRITNVEYSEADEQTMQQTYPNLVLVFPGGSLTAQQTKAAHRNHFDVYVAGRC